MEACDVIGHPRFSRRAIIAGGAAALAGCIEPPTSGGGSGDPSAMAAFYTLMDWGNEVGGDVVSFDTPIEVGEMGHGWHPDASIVPDIASTDAFLYLATPEFQWTIDAAEELRNDASHEVHLIDGMEAIPRDELLSLDGEREHEHAHPDGPDDPDDLTLAEIELRTRGETTASWHDGHWHGSLPDVPLDETRRLTVHPTDSSGTLVPLGDDHAFRVESHTSGAAVTADVSGDTLDLVGDEIGNASLTIAVHDAEGPRLEPDAALDVTVVEAADGELDPFVDPHVWVDPINARSIVDHLADELAEVLPDHAETFHENATEYGERIDAVDETFSEISENADLEVAVLVAHDAFRYLERRYDLTFHTPVGVTPDAAESIEDLSNLVDTIDTYDIETILYDPFESTDPDESMPTGARVLLENSDAQHAEPFTAAEGLTPEWRDAGYGWVEQMEEINIPSLRRALRIDA